MPLIHEFAPAKLNLYLHITGRLPDGYHHLDSLVVFASVGDQVRLDPASTFSFHLEGPQAPHLSHEDNEQNLVVKAVRSLAQLTGHKLDFKLTLVKNLPVASGIGGGSSDAAAALRAAARHWGIKVDDPVLGRAAVQHGQDVPVCLKIENNYITETGTSPATHLPHLDCVLVNPGKGLPTPTVYRSYRDNDDPFSKFAQLGGSPDDAAHLIRELQSRGNDLYIPACRLMPEIKNVIAALGATDALLARMSGSGATCFGLYADRSAARSAANVLHAKHPDWWVAPCYLPYKTAAGESVDLQTGL